MKMTLFLERMKLFGILLAAGVIGGAIALIGQSVLLPKGALLSASSTAGPSAMEYIDALNCKRAESKVVKFHGKDDQFSYEGIEPAKISPALLKSPYYRDLAGDKNKGHSHRDYDERGVDKILLDQFAMSGEITSGVLVTRAKPQGNTETDNFILGDFERSKLKSQHANELAFGKSYRAAMSDHLVENTTDLLAIPLHAFENNRPDLRYQNLLSYLESPERSPVLDFEMNDDTMLDFAALITCQLPEIRMGTTFIESDYKLFGPKVSHMGCNLNKMQPMCDPIIGDQLCSVPTPLACYKDGNRSIPENQNVPTDRFIGGEVRMTPPVRGDQFETHKDALDFCKNQFGEAWRVLSFHESGGGAVTSISNIPVNSRVLIDVTDQPYATCWSRD